MQKNLLHQAFQYLAMGFSVIPVGQNKRSLVPWREYQKRMPTEDELRQWFETDTASGIAIITGSISGNLLALDFERDFDLSTVELPRTVTSKTGGGGFHYFYRYPQDKNVPNFVRIRPDMDIRGEGGYALVPPSLHPSGKPYEWVLSFDQTEVADVPQWVLDLTHRKGVGEVSLPDNPLSGVAEGARNDTAASVSGKLMRHFPQREWESFCWPMLQFWNRDNKPPLESRELRQVFSSIAARAIKEREEERPEIVASVSTAELFTAGSKEIKWTVQDLIPSGGMVVLSGNPGHGKTWIALSIAQAVATGALLFGKFPTTQSGVLIVDEENGRQTLVSRGRLLGFSDDIPIRWMVNAGIKITNPDHLKKIIAECDRYDVKLVIFDSLVRIHDGEENSAKDMSRVFSCMKQITNTGRDVLFTHHHRKDKFPGSIHGGSSLRGSTDILAAVESHIAITRKDSEIAVTQPKLRPAKPIESFKLSIEGDNELVKLTYAGEAFASEERLYTAKVFIVESLQNGTLAKTELEKLADGVVGRKNLAEALKGLETEGLIEKHRGRSNKHSYSLKTSEAD